MLALAALARASASRATCTSRRWPPVPPAVRLAARTVSVACVSSASDAGGDNNPFSGKGLGHRLREVALSNPDAVAVVTSDGEEITYGSLLTHAEVVAGRLRSAAAAVKDTATDGYEKSDKKKKNIVDANILRGTRVAVSAVPGPEFVAAMHAAWLCGAIAVPMACGASVGETAYVLRDARVSAWALVLDLTDTNTDTATAAVAAAGVSATLVVPPVPRKAQNDTRSNSSNSRRESRIGTSTVRENSVSASFANSPEKTDDDDGALIIYTSGTTGSPKGVLHTHASLRAQCESLVSSWEWSPHDRILHVLPLHHIHGLVNAWMCAHFVGAVVEFGPSASGFSPRATWARLRKGLIQVSTGLDEPSFEASNEGFETGSSNSPTFGSSNSTPVAHTTTTKPITVFMGVPTMYVMLLKVLAGAKRLDPTKAAANSYAARNLRLAVSGSAAMPTPVMLDWQASTGCGELLLERYGMTEIGMALSNPLFGERTPGTVGVPLPGVAVKLAPLDLDGIESIDSIDSKQSKDSRDSKDSKPSKRSIRAFNPLDGPGELLVKGPGVFREYWGRPEITADCFDEDGYFKTGDAVERVNGVWKILGRTSVDVLKTGGHKVSALEVEAVLLGHPLIAEVAVVGVPCDAFGERGVAILVLKKSETGEEGTFDEKESTLDAFDDGAKKSTDAKATAEALRTWSLENMAAHKAPVRFVFVHAIPRNAMGKVNKKNLQAELDLGEGGGRGLLFRNSRRKMRRAFDSMYTFHHIR